MAKIEIYVVTTLNPKIETLNEYKKALCKKFGGLTIIPNCSGLWINAHGEVENDEVEIWQILTHDIDAKFINDISEQIRISCGQKTQLYTMDDKPFFTHGTVQYCKVTHDYINPKDCVGCTMC